MLASLAGVGTFGALIAAYLLGRLYERHHHPSPLRVELAVRLDGPEGALRCVLSRETPSGGMRTPGNDQGERGEGMAPTG